MTICIVDTGASNAFSLQRSLLRIGYESFLAKTRDELEHAQGIILPGVGNFDAVIGQIRQSRLEDSILHCICQKKIPILGICVGMQILFNSSAEGFQTGLSVLNGKIKKLSANQLHKLPNNGFREVTSCPNDALYTGLKKRNFFYFNHRFGLFNSKTDAMLGHCTHSDKFVASINYENIYGVQFHPEKSHLAGLKLLQNFASLVPK